MHYFETVHFKKYKVE